LTNNDNIIIYYYFKIYQFLYEAGYGSSKFHARSGIIGVTQPRRVVVLATAKRVAYELGVRLGKEVGFQVRYDKKIGENCSIKFMTDGILLREVQVVIFYLAMFPFCSFWWFFYEFVALSQMINKERPLFSL